MAVASSPTATGRRLLYGLNVVIGVVAATALVGVVVYLGDRFSWRTDLTKSGVNSLSPRTQQVITSLDQDVTITGMYTVINESLQKFAEKRRDTVRDMLKLFESSSRRITGQMLDPLKDREGQQKLLERIRSKPAYKDESAPHAAAVAKVGPLISDLTKLSRDDTQTMQRLAQADQRLTKSREFVVIANSFTLLLNPTCEDLADKIESYRTSDIPRYGRAVEAIKSALPQIRNVFEEARGWFAKAGQTVPDASAEAKQFFNEAADKYKKYVGDIDELLRDVEPLKPVKLDQIADALANAVNSPPIVVETPNEARVVPYDEVWQFKQDEAETLPDKDDRVFNGEEAILSAVLALTNKDKVGVVFTRYGGESPIQPDFSRFQPGQPMPTAPFIQLKMKLEKLGFVVSDWDLATVKTPPAQEGVTKAIYVVMPPTPPPPQNPMRPQPPPPSISPDDKQKIYDAITSSGRAMFLAESSAQRGPGEPYAFGEYLKKTWGIDVKSNALAMAFRALPDKPGLWTPVQGRAPVLRSGEGFDFTMQPIGKPLRASVTMLYNAAPLAKYTGEGAPSGLRVEPVAETLKSDSVWMVDDWNALEQEHGRNRGVAPPTSKDLLSPFPVIMASSSDKQRVVVFGSTDFARDEIAQYRQIAQSSDGLTRILLFPGNTDLFTNALFWILGDEGRISIGTRTGDVPRLDKLTPGMTANFWKGFIVAGWPALALVVGGVVALVRRR